MEKAKRWCGNKTLVDTMFLVYSVFPEPERVMEVLRQVKYRERNKVLRAFAEMEKVRDEFGHI